MDVTNQINITLAVYTLEQTRTLVAICVPISRGQKTIWVTSVADVNMVTK
jgi:hypothetical protein